MLQNYIASISAQDGRVWIISVLGKRHYYIGHCALKILVNTASGMNITLEVELSDTVENVNLTKSKIRKDFCPINNGVYLRRQLYKSSKMVEILKLSHPGRIFVMAGSSLRTLTRWNSSGSVTSNLFSYSWKISLTQKARWTTPDCGAKLLNNDIRILKRIPDDKWGKSWWG